MPSSERHAEHVIAEAAAAGTQPIGPSDVPPISREGVERERAEASRELTRDERQVDRAERALQRAQEQQTREREAEAAAVTALAQITGELDELRDADTALEAACSAAEQALDDAIDRAERAHRHAGDWAELSVIVTECEVSVAEPDGTDAAELSALVQRVEELWTTLTSADAVDDPEPDVTVLGTWRTQLGDGSAPLRPAAAALLDEIERVEAESASCGAGDVAEDPVVTAARERVTAARAAVAEVDERGVAGSAGHEARTAIEQAHRHRTTLEEQGRRADPDQLAEAIENEQAALARVGFDSMLDFRIVMSGAGAGVLAAKRREVVAGELAAAERELDVVQTERARHHTALRERRAALRARAVRELELDPGESVRTQLRRRLGLPDEVAELFAQLGALAREASGVRAEVDRAMQEATVGRDRLRDERADARGRQVELESRRTELEERVRDAGSCCAEADRAVDDAVDALAEARERHDAARARLAELESTPYLAEDLDRTVEELSRSIIDGVEHDEGDDPPTVVLDDPLVDLPVDATLSLLDLLTAAQDEVEVVLVTSRRPLLSALRRRGDSVRLVDGRRRLHRFGRRRVADAAAPAST